MTKILIYDIETAPNLAYVWGLYEQNVIRVEKEWHMLSFAYKWLGENKTHAYGLVDFPMYKKDKTNDKQLLEKLHSLFDEADIIIAHNGNEFDIKKTNARFIYHGLPPPSPYKQLDTKQIAKRYFKFDSNSLNSLGQHLGLGTKLSTGGFDLWLACMSGDKKAWKKMLEYNKQDVMLLEEVYYVFRPWITNHPNVNVLEENNPACTACGCTKLTKRGFGFNNVTKYQRYQCTGCGKWNKSKPISIIMEMRNV
jgi:hypothetical protein